MNRRTFTISICTNRQNHNVELASCRSVASMSTTAKSHGNVTLLFTVWSATVVVSLHQYTTLWSDKWCLALEFFSYLLAYVDTVR